MTLFSNLDILHLIPSAQLPHSATTGEFFVYTFTFVQIHNFLHPGVGKFAFTGFSFKVHSHDHLGLLGPA